MNLVVVSKGRTPTSGPTAITYDETECIIGCR